MAKKDTTQKKKKRPSSVRNRRWAVIVAAVLALGMALSTVGMYLGYITGRDQAPEENFDLEAYLEQYRYNAEQLEADIEELGPNVAMLEKLAENYYYLIMFKQMLGAEEDDLADYQAKLVGVYQNLLELEPGELHYHLELLEAYRSIGEEEAVMLEQAVRLQELLRENPVPNVGLSLIGFLESIGQDELVEEEAIWLRATLEEQLAEEPGDDHNYTRYLYAFLLAEYQNDIETAVEQLDLIIDSEPSESDLYGYAQDYRDRLTAEEDGDSGDEE